MELWRDVRGYEGLYQVSNYDRVRSLDRYVRKKGRNGTECVQPRKGKILRQHNSRGYLFVALCKNGVHKAHKIHQLVAQAFIPNPLNYDNVHHKDHNPLNNMVENLEWMNSNEHVSMHARERAIKRGRKTIYQYTLEGELVAIWDSAREVEKQLGYNHGCISMCCKGGCFYKRRNKWVNKTQHKGYRWSYTPL